MYLAVVQEEVYWALLYERKLLNCSKHPQISETRNESELKIVIKPDHFLFCVIYTGVNRLIYFRQLKTGQDMESLRTTSYREASVSLQTSTLSTLIQVIMMWINKCQDRVI